MKLEYFDLISSDPLPITNVGSLRPVTLRDIRKITRRVYETYLSFLSMTPMKYCTEVDISKKAWFESLDDEQLCALTMYDIALSSDDMIQMYTHILDFFFAEQVVFSEKSENFLVFRQDNIPGGGKSSVLPGIINKSNFTGITDIILQLNHISAKTQVDLTKVKSSKGRTRYLRMQKAKTRTLKKAAYDENIELGNIISVVCTKHRSINYLNVWDLTIYQIWDIFSRLQAENAYELNRTSVAVWGNKENKFDLSSWYHNISK